MVKNIIENLVVAGCAFIFIKLRVQPPSLGLYGYGGAVAVVCSVVRPAPLRLESPLVPIANLALLLPTTSEIIRAFLLVVSSDGPFFPFTTCSAQAGCR